MIEFQLTGPRGDNPLGFLAALGALVTLEDAGWNPRLGWSGVRPRLAVAPPHSALLASMPEVDKRQSLLNALHTALRREHKPGEAPDPSVRLGKNLNVPNRLLLRHTDDAVQQARQGDRRWVDLVAAYGVADALKPEEQMLATPWALVSGSGHQHFLGYEDGGRGDKNSLEGVAALMVECEIRHLARALFGPWIPEEERKSLSLRLDPSEDRQYALMDRDPSGTDRRPRSLWGANRLAFEALRLFPAMPAAGGMAVRGWRLAGGTWRQGCKVRWPLWEPLIPVAVVGSLLGFAGLWRQDERARAQLRALGVHAIFESRRIAVGERTNVKYNLTPPNVVWRG